MTKSITKEDLENTWEDSLSSFLARRLGEYDLSYLEINNSEKEEIIRIVLDTLLSEDVKSAGPHRLPDWIAGWAENHREFASTGQASSLIPKYFGKLPYVRWKQRFIKPLDHQFEYNMASLLQYWLFEKYLGSVNNIYEFGCGTGHNLLRAHEANNSASLYGLDWAVSSQDTLYKINEKLNADVRGHRFDFFNIDHTYNIRENSGVYTFAALEQVGDGFMDFVDYLVTQSPQVCIHIEPMPEYLDEESLVDYLSIQYIKKRNYVNGLKEYLISLEKRGKIEIIQSQRSFVGSMFVDGYSILVWKPTNA